MPLFNINEKVRVRLTDAGRQILAVQRADLNKMLRLKGVTASPLPLQKPEEDGWSTWQLWDLMQTFGPHLYLGNANLPFEADIEILTPA